MWQIVPGCRRPLGLAFCFAGSLALLQIGCSSQSAARTGAGTAGTAAARDGGNGASPGSPSKTEKPTSAAPLPTPPDGKWLVDEKGRQYFVDKIPKQEGGYIWLDPEKTQVQVRYGGVYDVVGQDEDNFHIKVYRVDTVVRPGPASEATPEKLAAVAATYRNGTGTSDRIRLEPFGNGLPTSGQWRNGFRLADMNGDGHPDIVHGPSRKGSRQPTIFLGDGKGNWRLWSEAKFPRLPYDYGDVAVADFNGDGRMDLALAVHLRGMIVLVSDSPQGAGFKEWDQGVDFHVVTTGRPVKEAIFSSHTVAAADMNGDGRPDIVTLGEGPRLAQSNSPGEAAASPVPGGYGMVIYFNQGDGTWVRRGESPADRVRLHGDKVVIGDFTHDGKLDTILGSNVLGAKNILRIGAADGAWTVADLKDLRTGFVGAASLADFNGDGRLDIAVGYLSVELNVWRTGVDVFLSRADGSWERRPVAVAENRSWLTALDSGDVDGDGKLDLVGLTGEGETWILLGKGDGSFVRETSPEVPPAEGGCKGYDVRLADLDGEPGVEIVAEFAGEPSAMFAPTHCTNEGSLVAWKARRKK